METAGGYDEYAFVADLYDWVVPYRERSDARFFVDAARESGGPVLDNPSLDALATRLEDEEFGDEPEFVTPDGRRVLRRHKTVAHDRFNQVHHVELIYYVTHPDGREERLVHAFPMRYLFRFEVEHLLARCGLEVEQLYSGFDKSPYGSRYPGELIFVVRKATPDVIG
jgi:hypothetical protein